MADTLSISIRDWTRGLANKNLPWGQYQIDCRNHLNRVGKEHPERRQEIVAALRKAGIRVTFN